MKCNIDTKTLMNHELGGDFALLYNKMVPVPLAKKYVGYESWQDNGGKVPIGLIMAMCEYNFVSRKIKVFHFFWFASTHSCRYWER